MEGELRPNIKWAERKDRLFVTIELNEVKDPKIELTEDNRLKFSGASEGKNYSLDLELYKDVNVAESKWNLNARNIFLNIKKKEKGPYWNYINKDKVKHKYIHPDWNMYIDEDEEDEKKDMGMGGMGGFPGFGGGNNFMNFGDMGGMGGMSGMDGMGMGGDEMDEDDVNEKKEGLDDLDKQEEL
jgi:hypothetical protein